MFWECLDTPKLPNKCQTILILESQVGIVAEKNEEEEAKLSPLHRLMNPCRPDSQNGHLKRGKCVVNDQGFVKFRYGFQVFKDSGEVKTLSFQEETS